METCINRLISSIKFYFKITWSKEFREDKHARFKGYQISITTVIAIFQAIWTYKDIFIIGLGEGGSLPLVVIGRCLSLFLLPIYYFLCYKYSKYTASFSNAMLFLNITGQFVAMSALKNGFTGEANIIFNFAIFTLHYASATGVSHVIAQILYTLSFKVLCQDGLGLIVFLHEPRKLLFTGYIFTVVCIAAATLFRVGYLMNWLNEQKLKKAAITDTMSGCYNRKRIAELTTTDEKMLDQATVIMLDIDKFKQFNDSKGHDFGDGVIIDTAKNLWAAFPRADIIRYGGDEFLIIDHEIMSLETISYKLGKNKLRADVTYSVGFSHGFKDDNLYGVIKQADLALYKSKKTRDTVTSYKDLLEASDLLLEEDLRNEYKFCF